MIFRLNNLASRGTNRNSRVTLHAARLLFCALFAFSCGHPSFAADKSGVSPNTISLPQGPGSIEGLGESFQPTLNTGTAKYGVRLTVPPGIAGQTSELALHYEGGGGNGPLGFGWSFSQPAIQRRCDKGIPTYGEDLGVPRQDIFINDSREELVPTAGGSYFCKNESTFVRYRLVSGHWEATLPDGTRQEYGLSESGRIQDGTNRVFSWLLERETDTRGNTILYGYTNFPGDTNLRQKYLASIRYGLGGPPRANYHFVVFRYEDRPDWFEDCRSGFVVRTGKRLKSIAIGTHGPVLPGHAQVDLDGDGTTDNLVRRYDLDYVAYAGTNSHWSLLGSVRVVGADGISSLPPSTFGYAVSNPAAELSAAGKIIGGVNEPDCVMGDGFTDLVDLNGDGLPDVLKTDAPGHVAWINRGETNAAGSRAILWESSRTVTAVGDDASQFALDVADTHLADMNGDGLADLVHRSGSYDAFFFANHGRVAWGERQPMSIGSDPLPAPFGDPYVRTADVDFDKRIDLIRGDGTGYQVWFNLGQDQYSERVSVWREDGVDFSVTAVQVADFNGDRVPDLARIWATSVEITAGLGYGRFAAGRSVSIPDGPLDSIEVDRAKLTDINGDGLADLVVERGTDGALHYWLN